LDRVRWSNLTRARLAFEHRKPSAGDGPLEAFFEVSALCNLRCVMCAINVDRRYRPGSGRPDMLEPGIFDTLRPSFPTLIRAYLFGLGEPMLNPRLCDYAGELSSAGVGVWFNTNGTLIDEAAANNLADAGVEAVTVSMDGASPGTYERIRRGADFNAVVGALRALTAARRLHGRPSVDVSFVAMASNLAELPDLVDLCAREGVASIHIEPLFAQQRDELGELYNEQNLGRIGNAGVRRIFAEAVRRGNELGVRLGSRFLTEGGDTDFVHRSAEKPPWWRCSEPWTSIWVTAAGEVRCCCLNDTVFGSLTRESLADIWNGPAFRAFRHSHARGELPPSCSNCRRNGRVRLSPYFAAVEPVSYRPLDFHPSTRAAGAEPVLDWPLPGGLVTDPVVLTGRLPGPLRRQAHDLDVVIDRTVVAHIGSGAVIANREFVISIPVPYLTEGAHIIRLRPGQAPQHRGWAHRTVHFWRPDAGAETLATDIFVLPIAVPRLRGRPRVLVDGAPTHYRWMRGGRFHGRHGAAVVDTARLAPGSHVLHIQTPGGSTHIVKLHRLPSSGA
jgi:MoaA/NifB/PqqE/SkfB family radical SAM enzyme